MDLKLKFEIWASLINVQASWLMANKCLESTGVEVSVAAAAQPNNKGTLPLRAGSETENKYPNKPNYFWLSSICGILSPKKLKLNQWYMIHWEQIFWLKDPKYWLLQDFFTRREDDCLFKFRIVKIFEQNWPNSNTGFLYT